MKFNKTVQTIFVDTHSKPFTLSSKVNVILSPSLYWVKKLTLPVKHARDVKKLLPSIFEDTLNNEEIYSYDVYKKDEDFFGFAYKDKVILDLLKEKGIESKNIANIYFAQSEFDAATSAFKIDEEQSLVVKDGVVILLPCCWVQESGSLNLSSIKHSKHKVTLAQYSQFIDTKLLYKLSAILVIFGAITLFEYFTLSQNLSQLQDKETTIFQKNHLKPTMFQNKSLLKKYNKLYTKQTNIRFAVANVLSVRLKKGQTLSSLSLHKKKLKVIFNGLKSNEQNSIKQKLKNKGLSFTSHFKKETLVVEVNL